MSQKRDQREASADRADVSPQRDELRQLIDSRELKVAFQPIVDLRTGEIIGYEALTRLIGEWSFAHIGDLFEQAETHGMRADLESVTRASVFARTNEWPSNTLLFLNSSPEVFFASDFASTILDELKDSGISPSQIILEITEQAGPGLIEQLGLQSLALRELGFRIALDDVGAGTSGLNRIMNVRPNWLKLDRELATGIDADPFKQNLIRFFARFARLTNIKLLAEGIERREELATLIDLGVTHGQGFFLAAPNYPLPALNDNVVELVRTSAKQSDARRFRDPRAVTLETLLEPAIVCQLETVLDDAQNRCNKANAAGVVVAAHNRCIGWIGASDLSEYCMAGMGESAISTVAIEYDQPLSASSLVLEAIEIVAMRQEAKLSAPIVVERDEEIVGVVSLRSLLRATAMAGSQSPSHTVPLTGLPSRVKADEWLTSVLRSGDEVDIAIFDISHFGPYNTSYGPEMGDVMLRRLVALITKRFDVREDASTFLAHLGEDRFLLGCGCCDESDLSSIIEEFETDRNEFYSAVDTAAAAFQTVDANGGEQIYPLNSVCIVWFRNAMRDFCLPAELYQTAIRLKKEQATSARSPFMIGGLIEYESPSDVQRRACA